MALIKWVLPGKLGRCSLPDYSDLILWKHEGVTAIVNLLEDRFREVLLDEEEVGFSVLHEAVNDFGAPTLEQLHAIVKWIDAKITRGEKVVVHCFAGIGRTGTALIAYLLYKKHDFEDARQTVQACGAAPQSQEQWDVLHSYENFLKNQSFSSE